MDVNIFDYYDICNRCGRFNWCRKAWPAPNGVYYANLCGDCVKRLFTPLEWERERLEFVGKYSE